MAVLGLDAGGSKRGYKPIPIRDTIVNKEGKEEAPDSKHRWTPEPGKPRDTRKGKMLGMLVDPRGASADSTSRGRELQGQWGKPALPDLTAPKQGGIHLWGADGQQYRDWTRDSIRTTPPQNPIRMPTVGADLDDWLAKHMPEGDPTTLTSKQKRAAQKKVEQTLKQYQDLFKT